jgi:integrase
MPSRRGFGTVRRLTSGRWQVRYFDRSGHRHTAPKTFATKVDAQRYLASIETDLYRDTWLDERLGRIRFAEWATQWQDSTVNLRASSRARDDSYLRSLILPTFGPVPVADIDHLAVRRWVADLSASGRAPATVVKAAQILGKIMRAAVDARMITSSPCDRVPLPRIDRQEMRFLEPYEIAHLAGAIDPRYRAAVLVAAYGGLRAGELFGLRPARVDVARGHVEVAEIVVEVRGRIVLGPPKTRAGRRTVPLPQSILEELRDHVGALPSTEFVFAAPEGGPVRLGQWRERIWKPALQRSGLAPLRIHDLRHTAVALWIAAGATPNDVARRAGHTSVVTVLDRYGHLLPGLQDSVTDALDVLARDAKK